MPFENRLARAPPLQATLRPAGQPATPEHPRTASSAPSSRPAAIEEDGATTDWTSAHRLAADRFIPRPDTNGWKFPESTPRGQTTQRRSRRGPDGGCGTTQLPLRVYPKNDARRIDESG